jgi:hypothetical protein
LSYRIEACLDRSGKIALVDDYITLGKFRAFYPYVFEAKIYVAPETPVLNREELSALAMVLRDHINQNLGIAPDEDIGFGLRDDDKILGIPSINYSETLATCCTKTSITFLNKQFLESAEKALHGAVFTEGRLVERQEDAVISTTRVIIYPSIRIAQERMGYEGLPAETLAELLPEFDLKSLKQNQ